MIAQLEVVPRTRNKFVEIVVAVERYLIITYAKNKESKRQSFRICIPVKLADGRMSIKKGKKIRTLFTILSVWARWLEKQNLFHEDKLNVNL